VCVVEIVKTFESTATDTKTCKRKCVWSQTRWLIESINNTRYNGSYKRQNDDVKLIHLRFCLTTKTVPADYTRHIVNRLYICVFFKRARKAGWRIFKQYSLLLTRILCKCKSNGIDSQILLRSIRESKMATGIFNHNPLRTENTNSVTLNIHLFRYRGYQYRPNRLTRCYVRFHPSFGNKILSFVFCISISRGHFWNKSSYSQRFWIGWK
jgi:hypothetical protein